MNINRKVDRLLGILVCTTKNDPPFAERAYYEQLAAFGKALDMTVVVFSPKQIDWSSRRLRGFVFDLIRKKWIPIQSNLPTVIYDRCFYVSPEHYKSHKPFMQKLRQDPRIELLGVPLKGKWQLAQLMKDSGSLAHFFPPTECYEVPQDALAFLHKYKSLVAKPSGGSHGRGIVAVFRPSKNGPYRVIGRTKQNKPIALTFQSIIQSLRWLHRFIGKTRYILQPYLQLYTPDYLPFDIRVLMQKDSHKLWQLTGMAVRIGSPYSLTSNLHGGGKAEKWNAFVQRLPFEPQTVSRIEKDIRTISERLPTFIERKHGRLCELGIDIGIDLKSRVWLLEVNSKPGRQVFRQSGDRPVYLTAIKRPLLYANALLKEK